MNPAHLSHTALLLRQPSDVAALEYEAARDGLAEELIRRMMTRPDLDRMIGPDNLAMMQDNSRNFARFMGSMFRAYEPEVLVQTALWVFRAYRSHGFQTTYWAANLDTFVELVRERLTPPTFEQVLPFLDWLIVSIPSFVMISDEQLAEPLAPPPGHEPRIDQ